MITKKKSSLLKTHKNIKKHHKHSDNNSDSGNSNNSSDSSNITHNSKTIHYKIKKYNDYYNDEYKNDYNNAPDYNSKYSIMSIKSNFTPSKTNKKIKQYKTF